MAERILDIHCPSCGGVAAFDIVNQRYVCRYCGGLVGIEGAKREKLRFKKAVAAKAQSDEGSYRFLSASCTSCGAVVSFEENEALSTCPFCGKTMVRQNYVKDEDFPQAIIPFGVTHDEAKGLMAAWCKKNRHRREAAVLRRHMNDLKGFYLPYELMYGPVHMQASRMGEGGTFSCEGFVEEAFVNRSSQLDNLLLDGMEPFDTRALVPFDYGFVAGQRVKTSDVSEKELVERVCREAEEAYKPSVRKTLESRAVHVDAHIDSALRMPTLLPVYYLCEEGLMAAVNGQTGKVSVRALKDSHYLFVPWWLKAIIATLAFCLACFGGMRLFGMESGQALLITGILALFFAIVFLCLYSETARNSFRVVSGRKVYTSGDKSFTRDGGELVLRDEMLERFVSKPVFTQEIDGARRPVVLRFTTPARVLKIVLTCIIVLFLPVILALLINGFDVASINLGGSAVWFCIAVPVVPVYLLKFGIVELYDRPWMYVLDERGRKKRYRKKREFKIDKDMVLMVLRAVFVPPASLAVWFGVISFFVMVYLTAGFD